MKILDVNLKKSFVKVIPESADDLWHLYNVILRNDEVYANTKREVKPDGKYERSSRGERVSVFLGVKVETVGWDRLLGRLRVHGTICEAPETVPKAAHHTINIYLNKPMTIVKSEWAKHHLDRLKKAAKSSEKPLIIVSIDDEGYAIATTAQYGVEEKIQERVKLPGKRDTERRDAATSEYFRKVLSSLRNVWMAERNAIVIIGAGFVKNDFAKFVENEAADVAKSVTDVKGVNNGGVAGIQEALRSGILLKTTRYLRIVEESQIMEEILGRLGKGESTITYGLDDVRKASESGAVETLAIADSLLRKASIEDRSELEELMNGVESKAGRITVISTEHEAGEKLVALGGIAALLRFPLYQQR